MTNFDIIIVTETHFKEHIMDYMVIGGTNYGIYRKDRAQTRSKFKKGGGVAILVRDCYDVELYDFTEIQPDLSLKPKKLLVETVVIKIKMNDQLYVIIAVYRPPHLFMAMTAELIEVIQCIENDHPEAEIIITGDLNCPNVTYSPCESNFLVPKFEQTRQADLRLIQFLDSNGYKQLIEAKNDFGNTLDVFFTKKPGDFAVHQLDDEEKIEPKNRTKKSNT